MSLYVQGDLATRTKVIKPSLSVRGGTRAKWKQQSRGCGFLFSITRSATTIKQGNTQQALDKLLPLTHLIG